MVSSKEIKKQMRELFLKYWSPEQLMTLQGKKLLYKMFGNKNYDSFTYWLENKHTKEFETGAFGGISGGSAENFILFQYPKINNQWSSKVSKGSMSEEEQKYVGILKNML